jgi:Flp pilus assembly protein TadG
VRVGRPAIDRRPSLRLHRREEGAAAVEFALISIVLFLVVFGIIQYGLWLSQYEVMQAAAREGARVAAVRRPSAEVYNAVNKAATPYAISGAITITPSSGCTVSTIGQLVTVSWTQTFQGHLFGLVPPLPDSKPIKGVFRCE